MIERYSWCPPGCCDISALLACQFLCPVITFVAQLSVPLFSSLLTVVWNIGVSKVVAVSRLLRGKYDLRERARMASGVVKRSAVRPPSFAGTTSKIRAQYKTGPPLRRVSMAAAERMSSQTAESRSGRGPETRKLMDKLADEIQDSLTKLFTNKRAPPSQKPPPTPLMRMERKPPVGKHPAVSI